MHEQLITPLNHESDRRRVVGLAIALATSGLAWTVRSATAIRGWCRSDPLILIDGHLADIVCDAPLEALFKVNGPTQIVVTVPHGVQANLVLAGPGFGRGEQVSFANSDLLDVNGNDGNDGNDENHGNDSNVENDGNDGNDGNDEDGVGKNAKGRKKAKGGKKAKGSKNKKSRTSKQKAVGKESEGSGESQETLEGIDVEIAVFVPAVENFPVGVDFAPRLLRILNPIRVEGSSNSWIRLAAKV